MVVDLAVIGLAVFVAMLGVGFLGAAGFVVLERHVGLEWALTITGGLLLILAVFIYLMRPIRPPPLPVPAPTPDPLTVLVFDMGVSLGRALFRRRN